MLLIKNVAISDEGKYVCVARNSAGDDVKNVKLELEQQEPSINGQKGKSFAKITARVLPNDASGLNGSLEIRGVRKNDEGRYTCFAKNALGESTLTVEVEVASLAEKPSFAFPNIEIIPIRQDGGGDVALECPARGKPWPEFAWLLPNGTMLLPGARLHRFQHFSNNGTLKISKPEPGDKGVYRCLAKNVAGQQRTVRSRGRTQAADPRICRWSKDHLWSVPVPALFCQGWPLPSVSWTLPTESFWIHLKPSAESPSSPTARSWSDTWPHSTRERTLPRHELLRDVHQLLPCGRDRKPATHHQHFERYHPSEPRSHRQLGLRGFRCSQTGDFLDVAGQNHNFPARSLHGAERSSRDGRGSLVIQNPVLTNSGIYKCNAKNALGTDFRSTYLQVV
ncbi:hypothetical protein WMY93_008681 [Mugilogobius chulae]|uniref:Ig-like domain-containing protein n=1 Tax=Mugilogobius chulae TaxID=88201 RepID=A0AAW0PMV0_9GOBI